MDLVERVIVFLVGCGFGFVLGYIVARLRTIETKLDKVKNERGVSDLRTNVLLAIVVVVVAYAAVASSIASNKTRDNLRISIAAICQSGQDARSVDRAMVEAIFNLATGVVQRDAGDPPLTAAETIEYNRYINRVNQFRSDMYRQIYPPWKCRPYVTDERVKPPTPPFPRIK